MTGTLFAPAHAGRKCAGFICGDPEQQARNRRKFISDRNLIWGWSQWSRSWQESKEELGNLPGFRHLGQGAGWAYENIAAVHDITDLLSEVSQGIVDIYHTEIFDPLTEGMGGFTPFEEAMKSQAESAAVTGTFGAAGAVGGALGSAARIIGTGLAGMGTPAFVTSTGAIIPGAVAPTATGLGGAGTGMGIGTGLGLGDRAAGISQAEMSLDEVRTIFHEGREIRRAAGRDPKAAKVFNRKDPAGVMARSVPGVLPLLRDVGAAAGGDIDAMLRLQNRRIHSLERELKGWIAVDPATPRNPWRLIFRTDPTGNIEYQITHHYAR